MTLNVEQPTAVAMINGFIKHDGRHYVTISTAHRGSRHMDNNFRAIPKLITPKLMPPRQRYPLSDIGRSLCVEYYAFSQPTKHHFKHVAIPDTIFHIENNPRIWLQLCNNGIFDIWDWTAPYNSLKGREDPMILVLRVCEIDHAYRGEITRGQYFNTIKPTTVKLLRPIIPNDRFEELKAKVRAVLQPDEKQVNYTNLLMQCPQFPPDPKTEGCERTRG